MGSSQSEGSQHMSSPDVKHKQKKKKKRESNHDYDKPKTTKKPKPKTVKKPTVSSRTDIGSKKVYKSAAFIDTSDDEADIGKTSLSAPISKGKEALSAKEPPKKRRKKTAASSSDAEAEESPAAKPKRIHSVSEPGPSKIQPSVSKDVAMDEKSESEMSVLIDAAPLKKKTRREKSSTKAKKASADSEKRKKKAGPATSKDEEAIKRLKSYVNACGVRKIWSKEFQDLDRPSQQVQRLKAILAELGMGGRPSMERAKEIKEKRALAKELADVRSFEQAVVGQSSRSRSKGQSRVDDQKSQDGDDDSSSDEVSARKDKNAARKSIMAFLGDDSDDEGND